MKAALLLLVLGLSGLLYVQWAVIPERAPDLGPQREAPPADGEKPPSQATGGDFSLGDPQAFDIISQRPLFAEGRRPPEEEAEEVAAPEQAEGLEGVDFSAVLITPLQSVAWVKEAESGELIRLEPGKRIRGWTVKAVYPDRLLLEDGEETTELELREFPDEAAPPRPPAPPVRPGARVPSNRPMPRQQRPESKYKRPQR